MFLFNISFFADLSHLNSHISDVNMSQTSSDVFHQFCAGQLESSGPCDKKTSLNFTLCDLTERKISFHSKDKTNVSSCTCEVSKNCTSKECYTLNCDCGGGKLDEACIICILCHTSPAEDSPAFNHWVLALLLYMFCVATVAGNFLVILAVAQVIIMT